jgi:hypothetical protein
VAASGGCSGASLWLHQHAHSPFIVLLVAPSYVTLAAHRATGSGTPGFVSG